MKLSVIVSTYNNPLALKRVLESLSYQTILPHDVIVADDGSGPETAELIRDLSKTFRYPLCHVWHEDQGFRLSKIRNEGIKKSLNDYVVFLDGDCIVERHFIEDHLRLAEGGTYVQGKRTELGKEVSEYFNASHANSPRVLFRMAAKRDIWNCQHAIRMPFLPAYKNRRFKGCKGFSMGLFRKDVLAVNGFNEEFVGWGKEDSEFVARLYVYGLKRKIHPFMAVCFHLWHPKEARGNLERNVELFFKARDGDEYWCKNGITKD